MGCGRGRTKAGRAWTETIERHASGNRGIPMGALGSCFKDKRGYVDNNDGVRKRPAAVGRDSSINIRGCKRYFGSRKIQCIYNRYECMTT